MYEYLFHPSEYIYIYILSSTDRPVSFYQNSPAWLDVILTKIKNRKAAAGLDEISPEVWKTRKFDDILFRYSNVTYIQNTIERRTKGYIFPFLKRGDIRIAKNYQGITLTFIAAKIYYALLLNRIEPEIEKMLGKNQNGFRRNQCTTSQILTISWILGARAKNLVMILLFVYFSTVFESIHQRKMEQILQAHGLPQPKKKKKKKNCHRHNDAF